MRVLQLIDSLRPGGAEKMAVNIANALLPHVESSFLCCTRQEGILKEEIKPEVGYLFLNKKSSLDLKAIFALRKYIAEKNIDILHAHGTSFFNAFIMKVLSPNLKLMWHDHWGDRVTKKIFSFPVLYICSSFFNGIITVNEKLLNWTNSNLLCKNTIFIRNFLSNKVLRSKGSPQEDENWTIVYVANFKVPKNHLNLLKAFKIILKKFPNCALYLVGRKYNDDYEKQILLFLTQNDLQKKVFLTGEASDVGIYLEIAKLGVISSDSEGLSMALLEYGIAGLPVVCTDVGENSAVVGQNGKVVEINNSVALAENIIFYMENEMERKIDAENFHNLIVDNYTENKIVPQISRFYKRSQS